MDLCNSYNHEPSLKVKFSQKVERKHMNVYSRKISLH